MSVWRPRRVLMLGDGSLSSVSLPLPSPTVPIHRGETGSTDGEENSAAPLPSGSSRSPPGTSFLCSSLGHARAASSLPPQGLERGWLLRDTPPPAHPSASPWKPLQGPALWTRRPSPRNPLPLQQPQVQAPLHQALNISGHQVPPLLKNNSNFYFTGCWKY